MSISPKRNIIYRDLRRVSNKQIGKIKNETGEGKSRTPYVQKRKPLSQSPRKYIFKLPDLPESDEGDTEENHLKPYVLINNSRPR